MNSASAVNRTEELDFVDNNGRPIRVVVSEKTGEILIPLEEIQITGFKLFRRRQYNKLLIDDKQVEKEFNLYLLGAARSYILEKRIAFNEQQILEGIDNCRKILTGENGVVGNVTSPPRTYFKSGPQGGGVAGLTFSNLSKFNGCVDGQTQHNPTSPTSLKNQPFHRNSGRNDYSQARSPPSSVKSTQYRSFQQNDQGKSFSNQSPPSSVHSTRGRNFPQRDQGAFEGKSFNKENQNQNRPFKNSTNFQLPNDENTKFPPRKPPGEGLKDFVPSIELAEQEYHDVAVAFVEKRSCIWVQSIDQISVLHDIVQKCREEAEEQSVVFRPVMKKIYMSLDDGQWFRCALVKYKPMTVFYIDYGNVSEVNEVKEVSEEIAAYPRQAVRISFKEDQYDPILEDVIRIKPLARYDDGTYVVQVENKEASSPVAKTTHSNPPPHINPPPSNPSPPSVCKQEVKVPRTPAKSTAKTYFNLPVSLCSLQSNQKVMVIGFNGEKLLLRTKECVDKLKEITSLIEKSSGQSIKVDGARRRQLVLAKKHQDGKLHRAVILDTNNDSTEIMFIDDGTQDNVPVNSLFNMTEELSVEPITYMLTPTLKGFETVAFSDSATSYIADLITKKTKCSVVLKGSEFDLLIGEDSLSQILKNLTKPQPSTTHSDRPLLNNMELYQPEKGVQMLTCYSVIDIENITFASCKEIEKHLNSILKTEMEDEQSYQPVVGEVCWGKYEDCWYRCAITDSIDSNTFKTLFIDFGNLEDLTVDNLRKLTADVKTIPVLGFPCKLIGLPNSPQANKALRLCLLENETYEVNVKGCNGLKYDVEIPKVVASMSQKL